MIRPFGTRRPTEIVSAPKVYGFDTGFICYYRGWQELRDEDLGILWEHFVLNEMMAHFADTRSWVLARQAWTRDRLRSAAAPRGFPTGGYRVQMVGRRVRSGPADLLHLAGCCALSDAGSHIFNFKLHCQSSQWRARSA